MNKRGVYLIFLAVLLLGCFFQYLRMDGFLHLGALRNFAAVERAKQQPWAEADAIARDRYLIFYDPEDVASMFARHNVERLLAQQKKDYESHPLREAVEIPQETCGVIFATGRVGVAASLSAALSYAAAGGTVLFTQRLEAADDTAPLTDEARGALGLTAIGGAADTPGVRFPTDFLLGVQGKAFDNGIYETQADAVTLAPDAVVDMESAAGVPLLWHHAYGAGEVIAYNGAERDDKTNRGVLAAMLAHCGEDAVYPVVGVKLFFIDDFPAPTPEGDFSKIYEETGLSTAEFYRENWWPWMQENARRFNLKYTGLIIETYNDQVKGPFRPLGGRAARDNVIVYGRELLKMGGELGLHGYNHQSLAPAGYGQGELEYMPWASQADMTEAMQELARYVSELYPGYAFRTYVPPSNILSPEGYAAVREAFPDVRIFASLYDGLSPESYYQDYERRADGTYAIPRVSAGYAPDGPTQWAVYSLVNELGVFSHFVHPDEMFYEESRDKTWAQLRQGMEAFLGEFCAACPWLTPVTASESLPYFDDYFALDYRVKRTPAYLELHAWNHAGEVRFLLRSSRVLDHAEGCTAEPVAESVYLVRLAGEAARLYWRTEEDA